MEDHYGREDYERESKGAGDQPKKYGYGYGKKSLWKWIIIYVIAGVIVYGLIYAFYMARNGGYNSNSQTPYQYGQ